ncbi:MAG: DNRLRE domain-containing protein [bacterium]
MNSAGKTTLLSVLLSTLFLAQSCSENDNKDNNPVNGNQELISTPNRPGGPGTGQPRENLTYTAGGASSNLGHNLQYRFDWGDGNYSAWLFSTSATHSWYDIGTYYIRVQARCASHTGNSSDWSGTKSVSIDRGLRTLTLNPTADAYVSSGDYSLNENYGGDVNLCTGNHNYGAYVAEYWSFVKFDLSSLPSNADIQSANLRLISGRNNILDTIWATVTVSAILGGSWSEYGVTYMNMPSSYYYLFARDVPFGNFTESRLWNIATALEKWISGEWTNHGCVIRSHSIHSGGNPRYYDCCFYSRDLSTGGAGPQLIIEYYEQ